MIFKKNKKQEVVDEALINIKHELRSISDIYKLPYNTLYSAVYKTIMETLEANKK